MDEHIENMVALSDAVRLALYPPVGSPPGLVVLSGAGTSGRLSALVASTYNAAGSHALSGTTRGDLAYLVAGGAPALLKSQESAEDVSAAAVSDLLLVLSGKGRSNATSTAPDAPQEGLAHSGPIVFVGISCGMSATYVGAQAEFLLQHTAKHAHPVTVCLLGFNPPSLVKEVPIAGWHSTYASVVQLVQQSPSGILLTPAVGPEAVAGSTRMKGGSATKLVLDTVCSSALRAALEGRSVLEADVHHCLEALSTTVQRLYRQAHALLPAVQAAGASLSAGGRVVYVGEGVAGVLGLIDASECPPTFGAQFEDVRGFVEGGYAAAGMPAHSGSCIPPTNTSGTKDDAPGAVLISEEGCVDWSQCGLDHFQKHVAPTLTPADTVVALGVLGIPAAVRAALQACAPSGAACLELDVQQLVQLGHSACLPLGCGPTHPEGELALKLACNAITTLAHVQRGAVFGNRMIDVRVSNAKLLTRAVGIIAEVSQVPRALAATALLRAIHDNDTVVVTDTAGQLPPGDVPPVIAAAAGQERLVPTAVAMCAAALQAGNMEPSGLPAVDRVRAAMRAHSAVAAAVAAVCSTEAAATAAQ